MLIFMSAEDEFKWSKVDAGIAVENMVLAAESLGLGTLIIGCVYDALHGEKRVIFQKNYRYQKGIHFRLPLLWDIRRIIRHHMNTIIKNR